MKIVVSEYLLSKYERKLLIFTGFANLMLLFNKLVLVNQYDFDALIFFIVAVLTLIPFGIFYKQIIKSTFISIQNDKLMVRLNPFKDVEKIEFNIIKKIEISKYVFDIVLSDGNSKIINLSIFSYQQREDELLDFINELKLKLGAKIIHKAT